MTEQSQQQNPLPEGWLVEFLEKADLDHSFNRLEACEHFHALTMRGRIRSLQLRTREASDYYNKAIKLALNGEATIPNLIRQFSLSVYKVENRIVEAPLEDDLEPPQMQLPALSDELVKEYPEVRLVVDMRLSAEALVRLHLGDWGDSFRIYSELITRNEKGPQDVLVMYYLGLAASAHNLGLTDAALKNFENVGLCLSMGGRLLNRVRGAGCLYAFYKYLGYGKQAREWKAFIDRLDYPEETKKVFLKRGARQVERCTRQAKLVLL